MAIRPGSDNCWRQRSRRPPVFNCAPLVLNVERLEAIPDFEQLREQVESEDFVLVGITGRGTRR